MPGGNYNMEDPSKQEEIRRGPHKYVATIGKHGAYVPEPYVHQEYPKMMAKAPKPRYEEFSKQNGVAVPGDVALQQFQAATVEWDRFMTSSIVHSKAEERAWLQEHGG